MFAITSDFSIDSKSFLNWFTENSENLIVNGEKYVSQVIVSPGEVKSLTTAYPLLLFKTNAQYFGSANEIRRKCASSLKDFVK